ADTSDAGKRLLEAVAALYRYYERTERMWVVSHRDVEQVEALREPMAAFRAYTESVADDLAAFWPDSRLVHATLRHAVRFATWASLHGEGLDAAGGASLVLAWIQGVLVHAAGRGKKSG